MQLVLNGSNIEDISESEPILSRSEISQRSESSSSSSSSSSSLSEITSAGANCDFPHRDLENLDADEACHLVNAEQPQCRICLDNEGEDLISPCHCKGTQKYVHRSCLDIWRSTKEGFAFAHCTECRAMFILRANVPSNRWWLRLKFQFLVARDHAFIFVVVQLLRKSKSKRHCCFVEFLEGSVQSSWLCLFGGSLILSYAGSSSSSAAFQD